ncbi:hypothetical protein [Labilibaculum euxinus]
MSVVRKVAVLVEGDFKIGMGHLYRCLSIGAELYDRGVDVTFFIPSNDVCISFCERNKVQYETFATTNFEQVNIVKSAIKAKLCCFNGVLIDLIEEHYRNFNFLTENLNLFILTITLFEFSKIGRYERLSFYPFCESLGYDSLEGVSGKIFIYSGPDFMTFSENVVMASDNNGRSENCELNVLISMGGSDPESFTVKALEALKQVKLKFKVNVVCGSANLNKNKVIDLLENSTLDFKYHENINYLPQLMIESDLAIINGGLTRYELTLVGTPYIALSLHLKQFDITEKLTSRTGDVNLGIGAEVNINTLSHTITKLLENYPLRKNIRENQKCIFDGGGVNRIVDLIIKQLDYEKN